LVVAHRDHPLGHLNLGVALLRLGDEAGTVAAWRRFLALAPDHAAAPQVQTWLEANAPTARDR
jgi:hypothetical protein